MIVQMTHEHALKIIGKHELVLTEVIVPAAVHLLSHAPYRPEYAWLFTVERRLGRIVEPWLSEYRNTLIGPGGLLSEALSNAYCHGHRRDASRPIAVWIAVGELGLLTRITDDGPGFDFQQVVSGFEHKKNYYHNAGRGVARAYTDKQFTVFYTDEGRCFNMLRRFGGAD